LQGQKIRTAGPGDTRCRFRGNPSSAALWPSIGMCQGNAHERLEPLLRESAVAGSGDTYRRVRGNSLQGQGVPIFRWCCSPLPSVRVCQDTYVKHSPGTPCAYAPCGALNVLAWGVLRHLPSVCYTSCTQLLLL